MANYVESDEAFARRLQAQELGTMPQNSAIDSQTPLVNRRAENPTVINARLSEINTSRATLYAIILVNTPQVLATIIVLSMHWTDPDICGAPHTLRWKWWAIFSAMRMIVYTGVALFMDLFRPWLSERRGASDRIKSLRNTIDAFGLIWFVVGNMWLFGDDDDNCAHPNRSPIYNLCVAMLVINYIQICLPCIIAILLIPVFCFCMPCLIRVLARLQDPRASTVGASDATIDALPVVKIDSSHIQQGGDNTCPICLNEMVVGEDARLLRCHHIFHKQCVDEWLRVNASCPTCRKRILGDNSPSDGNQGTTRNRGSAPDTVTAEVTMSPFSLSQSRIVTTTSNGRSESSSSTGRSLLPFLRPASRPAATPGTVAGTDRDTRDVELGGMDESSTSLLSTNSSRNAASSFEDTRNSSAGSIQQRGSTTDTE